jgi:regulator of replication initiation timing
MNARYTEIRKQKLILLAENTEMRKHLGILSKQYAFLLAENTKMRKHLGILSKQTGV